MGIRASADASGATRRTMRVGYTHAVDDVAVVILNVSDGVHAFLSVRSRTAGPIPSAADRHTVSSGSEIDLGLGYTSCLYELLINEGRYAKEGANQQSIHRFTMKAVCGTTAARDCGRNDERGNYIGSPGMDVEGKRKF